MSKDYATIGCDRNTIFSAFVTKRDNQVNTRDLTLEMSGAHNTDSSVKFFVWDATIENVDDLIKVLMNIRTNFLK
jgi:hypothetical protein